MGQIVGGAAKPKRCNINQLSQLGTPAAGEYILVSSDNSMNAAGQGNFDAYVVGNGTTAASSLELNLVNKKAINIFLTGNNNTGVLSGKISLIGGNTYRIFVANPSIAMDRVTSGTAYTRLWVRDANNTVYVKVYMKRNLSSFYDFTPPSTGDYQIGMRANEGAVQKFEIVNISEISIIDEMSFMPDEYYYHIDTSNVKTATTHTSYGNLGIKYYPAKRGETFAIQAKGSSYSLSHAQAVCTTKDKSTFQSVVGCGGLYELKDGYYLVSVEDDCYLAISFCFDEPVYIRKIDTKVFLKKDPTNNAYLKNGTYRFVYYNANCFKLLAATGQYEVAFVPIKYIKGTDLYFPITNDSYTIPRIYGLKNGGFVFQSNSGITKDDAVLGTLLCVTEAQAEQIDMVAVALSKVDGKTDTEYNAFGFIDTYSDDEDVVAPRMLWSAYYPVGSVAYYRSGKLSSVIADKAASSYPSAGTLKEFHPLDFNNIPVEDSMAEFSAAMNEKAVNIGMTSSTWLNPYGGRLYGFNYTTAADLLKLAVFAAGNPTMMHYMGCESASVTIYGAHAGSRTITNNINSQIRTQYSDMHSGATCPYRLIGNKAGAHANEDGEGVQSNKNGFALMLIAEVEGKYIAAVTGIGNTALGYTEGRTRRVKGMIELLDICASVIRGESITGRSVTFCDKAVACEIPAFPTSCKDYTLTYLYSQDPTTIFMPASVSKVMAAVTMLDILNMAEYHSIWGISDELVNDSDYTAYSGDVQSVAASFYAMLLASEGANTLSLARVAGEHIIKNKSRFV